MLTLKGNAILFSEMTLGASWVQQFNRWYDEMHIPSRLEVPGFISAQRYLGTKGNYLAIYELESLDALRTKTYERVKQQPPEKTEWMLDNVTNFTRYLGTEISFSGNTAPSSLHSPFLYA